MKRPDFATRGLAFLCLLVTLCLIAPRHAAAQSGLPPDLVLHAAGATALNGSWQRVSDTSAAAGVRLWQPDAGAPKSTSPSSMPRDYFEVSFQAEAGRPYRLWLRGLAQGNSYNNDSVYVQFSGSVNASGTPVYRIGTTSGTAVVIEDCSGCGVSGWGWQDNEYGGTSFGQPIYFATTGPQTLRIQGREDGISIDQIVLSSSTWFTTRPGAVKNDATILTETQVTSGTGSAAGPVSFSTADYVAGPYYDLAAVADVNGDGKPDVVGFFDNSPLEFWSFTNNGDRSFTNAQFIEDVGGGQYGALAIAVGDFTSDGRKDVLFLHGTNNALVLGTGDGAGSFTFWTGGISFTEHVADFAAADFDRDGVLDVVTIEPSRNAAVIYKGDGAGHFSFVSYGTTANAPESVLTGDIDGDGRIDAITVSRAANTITLLYGDGTGRFRSRGDLYGGSAPRAVALGDLNRDGRPDLAISTGLGVTLYLAATGGGWEAARQIDTSRTSTAMPSANEFAIADMNRDGLADLIVGHRHGAKDIGFWQSVTLLYGDGQGGFGTPDEFATSGTAPLNVADFDADGRPDILAPQRGAVMWNAAFTDNHAPAAQATASPGTSMTTSQEVLSYLWSTSTDPDGHLLTYSWKDPSAQEISYGPLAYPYRYVQQPAGTYTYTLAVDDLHGATASTTITITITSDATGANHPPVAQANVSMNGVWPYEAQFQDEPDPNTYLWSSSTDPDGDPLAYEWRDEAGRLLSTSSGVDHAFLLPGSHTITLTVRDGRGGESSSGVPVTVKPFEEIVITTGYKEHPVGASWERVEVPPSEGAASNMLVRNPDAGAPKISAPLAAPSSYVEFSFPADPTQEYKLWIRLRAQNDYWGNDSVWVQFTGAADAAGNAIFRTGTASGMMVNLEECSGCGISGWGWRDDAWGTAGTVSRALLRFPQGGVQTLRVQTREDGVSIDHIVLSARKYRTTRPGAVKNDTTLLYLTAMWGS